MAGRGLVVAAPRSGSGKTVLTLALLAALSRRGLAVRAAKTGPDYIDAAFHAAAVPGGRSINLDTWAMPPALLDALYAEACRDADVLVVEGVMGLFDGVAGTPGRCGSTADLAARFGLPVLLVVDVSGQSQSAAALVRGFAEHGRDVRIAGVVLNRIASERHRSVVTEAIAALNIPVLGAIPRDEALHLPERHLGLVQVCEQDGLRARLEQWANLAERHCDLDAVIGVATETSPRSCPPPQAGEGQAGGLLRPPGQRIALACDAAFSFIYPHIIAGWRRAGAEIVRFSPVADEAPPQTCDCCWLPGGYPELHAAALSAAERFRAGLAQFARTRPVHGECGGYMVLGEGLQDATGAGHAMAGLLSHSTSFKQPKLHLGYREAKLLCAGALGPAGTSLRGHEFHYATVTSRGCDEPLSELWDGQGRSLPPGGGRRGNVTGSFFHIIAAGGRTGV